MRSHTKPLLIGGGVLVGLAVFGLVLTEIDSRSSKPTPLYTDAEREQILANARAQEQKVATSQPTTLTQTRTSDQSYKRGFKAGMDYGKLIGRHPESGGIGTEEAIQQDARGSAILSDGSREDADWQRGWVDGYKKGFLSIRGAGRNEEDFEVLSAANALPGVKVYTNDGKYAATIISVAQNSDLMTVRYKDGTVEPKDISALAKVWFVKKN